MLMCELGVVPLSRMPDSYNYDRSVYPSARLLLEAMPYRAGEPVQFAPKTPEGFLAIKEWLADGGLVVVALPISEALSSYGGGGMPEVDNDVIYGRGGPLHDAHALTLIGYDDTRPYFDGEEARHGAFYGVNSWGRGWGVEDAEVGTGGFFWVGYDYFKSAVMEAWSVTERDDADPEWVGLIEYEHPYAVQVGMDFFGGSPDDPAWSGRWTRFIPTSTTSYTRYHPLAIDLTDYTGMQSEAFWWRIVNIGFIPGLPHPGATGTAHDFRLYRYQDLLDALPERLLDVVIGGYRWHSTPMHAINAPYIAGQGLPVETPILDWQGLISTDVSLGLMDLGEDVLDPPVHTGDAIFADLTGSGLPDLVVVGGGATQVFENNEGILRRVENHGLNEYTGAAVAAGDFNRNGRPDLAIYGRSDGVPTTRIYENLGNLRFRDIEANLIGANAREGVFMGSIAWGDYDQDGLEDLAYWAFDSKQLHVYRNLGNGSFERAPFDFPSRWEGGVVGWHDINSNGLLDLTWGSNAFLNLGGGVLSTDPIGFSDLDHSGLAGSGLWADLTGNGVPDLARQHVFQEREDNIIHTLRELSFYRNLGDGTLTPMANIVPNLHFPRMVAVDYNNSGRMDLVSTHYTGTTWMGGYNATVPRATAMLRQLPDGTFRDAGFDLLGTSEGAVALGDINGDGSLDLLTTGRIHDPGGGPIQLGARLHRSRFAEQPFPGLANTPPLPPTHLQTVHDAATGETRFLWDHGTDEQTPREALAYNVRVGTWPGGGNILSPASSAPVTPVVRIHRIAPDQPGVLLRNLPPGRYYWSVRSVDGGRMASDWAPEQQFALLDGYIVEDVNQDRIFDAADLVRFANIVGNYRESLPLHYDFSGDERVNQADLRTLAKRLLGSSILHPSDYVIGPEGGTITLDGMQIHVPPGAFRTEVVLEIERTTTGGAFEPHEAPEVFRISGAPVFIDKPWYILFEPQGPAPELPLVLLGEKSFGTDGAGAVMRHRFEEPELLDGGWYRVEIPALAEADLPPHLKGENSYDFNAGVLNLSGYARYAGPRFAIYFPRAWAGDAIENLMQGLERAHSALRDDFGFSYSRRTRWPLEVYVKPLTPPDTAGLMVTSFRGVNYGWIEINKNILGDFETTRATASHEFFHIVQGLYDPANRLVAAGRSTYPRWWLDEAMSTWAEELVVSNPAAYIPETYAVNLGAPFLNHWGEGGAAYGLNAGRKVAADFGYGHAPLIRYLVNSGRGDGLVRFYEATLAGADPIEALKEVATDFPLRIWYDDFLRSLIEGRIYPYPNSLQAMVPIAGPTRRMRLEPRVGRPVSWRSFDLALPSLSVAPHLLYFTSEFPDPPQDASFAIRLEGEPELGLQVFRVPNQDGMQAERVASAFASSRVKFGLIPNAHQFKSEAQALLVAISNTEAEPPYTQELDGRLAFGLARPGPFAIETMTNSALAYGRRFPTFTSSGTVEADAISDFTQDFLVAGIRTVEAVAWGRDDVELTISMGATIGENSISWTESGTSGPVTVTLSTPGIEDYRLYKTDDQGVVIDSWSSDSGTFTFQTTGADREDGIAVFDVSVAYQLSYHREGWAEPSVSESEWPIAYFLFTLP